ncbi:hypothetical protein GCM10011371_10260 [Novosphingobium marinum]|nr:hypothetical protein GCM10011371_10260 [Novosphingobium marinum]
MAQGHLRERRFGKRPRDLFDEAGGEFDRSHAAIFEERGQRGAFGQRAGARECFHLGKDLGGGIAFLPRSDGGKQTILRLALQGGIAPQRAQVGVLDHSSRPPGLTSGRK